MSEWTTNKPVIKREDVLMVYTGKRGCMCGCLGKYRYTKASAELAVRNRGYTCRPEEINEGQVTRVLNIMAKLDNVQVMEIYSKQGDSLYYGFEADGRHIAVYTKPGVPYVKPEHLAIPEDPYEAARNSIAPQV